MTDLTTILNEQIREVEEAVQDFRLLTLQALEEELVRPRGAGGRMRIDTGFLRASLRSSTTHMPQVDPEFDRDPDGTYPYEDTGAALTTTYTEDVYLAFTAKYAPAREKHDMFVEGAVQEWPRIVSEAEARVMQKRGMTSG